MTVAHQYVFVDFEFTMLEKDVKLEGFYPEIIEVGMVIIQNDQIVEKYSSFVQPRSFPTLSERCKSFLNITQEQVDSGITLQQLTNKFASICKDVSKTTFVTWGNMDMKVLRNNCEQANLPYPIKGRELDLSLEYKRFFGNKNQTGLWKAVQEYGKEGVGKHHRALDDALTTYHIFRLIEKDKKYLNQHEPTTIGDRIDLSKLLNKFA